MTRIVLFDGECNFCDRSVQFIIKRDPNARFMFASLQSEAGEKLLMKYNIPQQLNSFVLIENSKWYSKSSAALRVCKKLKGLWKVFYLLLVIPKQIRDPFYEVISRNRYKWFGKKKSCKLPPPGIKRRFL